MKATKTKGTEKGRKIALELLAEIALVELIKKHKVMKMPKF